MARRKAPRILTRSWTSSWPGPIRRGLRGRWPAGRVEEGPGRAGAQCRDGPPSGGRGRRQHAQRLWPQDGHHRDRPDRAFDPARRQATFDPQLIARYQRRFPGFDDKIVSMYARGMSTRGDRRAPARALRHRGLTRPDQRGDRRGSGGGRCLAGPAAGAGYPIVFFDALRIKVRDEGVVRNKAVHIALGVRADGSKEILGLWLEQKRGRKFWLRVMTSSGTAASRTCCWPWSMALKGFPDAIAAVFPEALVQTCIVHLLRHSLDFVSYKDRKLVAGALKDIYRALDAALARRPWRPSRRANGTSALPSHRQSWRRAGAR